MRQRATVRDVAAAAGVSLATASRALSGNPTVSPVLARQVVEAGHQLGYTANAIARALRTQRTGAIGVVVPAINNPYFVGAVEALEGVLAESERSLILCDARESPVVEAARVELLMNRMVDGLVVIPSSTTESGTALRSAAERGPVVQFDRYVDDTGADFVGSDNAEGVRQMVSHVRSRGCKTLAYVGAKPTISSAAERLGAFSTLNGRSSRRPAHWELLGDFSTDWGMAAGHLLLAGGRLPDAVVCGADVIAIGLLSVLRDAGVDVPGDVKVVSHDDLLLDRITYPKLSSVRQPLESMAREAVRLLDDRAAGNPAPPRKSVFAPALMVRESTGDRVSP